MSASRSASQSATRKQLRTLPGVGPSIARDLWELGVRAPEQLKGRSPEKLYDKFCQLKDAKVDRCLLYTFRCAIHFVERENHTPACLQWWNWSDEKQGQRRPHA